MSIAPFQPVRSRTLSDEVADQLRDAIRTGALSAGARLIEQELAERLGVSRIPVREAIQALVDEGLIRKSPHRGAYVYLPSRDEIDEISSLRVVLERFVMARVIQNWNRDHEATLRGIVARMRDAMNEGNFQQVYEQDYAFHRTLWEIADHSLLLEIVSSLRSRISRMVYEATSALPPAEANEHVAGHEDLVELLNAGDAPAAEAAIDNHIQRAKERIFAYCKLDAVVGADAMNGDGNDA